MRSTTEAKNRRASNHMVWPTMWDGHQYRHKIQFTVVPALKLKRGKTEAYNAAKKHRQERGQKCRNMRREEKQKSFCHWLDTAYATRWKRVQKNWVAGTKRNFKFWDQISQYFGVVDRSWELDLEQKTLEGSSVSKAAVGEDCQCWCALDLKPEIACSTQSAQQQHSAVTWAPIHLKETTQSCKLRKNRSLQRTKRKQSGNKRTKTSWGAFLLSERARNFSESRPTSQKSVGRLSRVFTISAEESLNYAFRLLTYVMQGPWLSVANTAKWFKSRRKYEGLPCCRLKRSIVYRRGQCSDTKL